MSYYSFAILLAALLSIAYAGQKVCPGYGFIRPPENCTVTCSRENDTCAEGLKCCFRLEEQCGFHCIVPKENIPKKGTCPSQSTEINDGEWMLCDGHMCDVDSDCEGDKKCCRNYCGSAVCIAPQ